MKEQRGGQQLLKVRNKAGNYVNVHSIQELRKSEKCESCGNPIEKHSKVKKLCPNRFGHFKQTVSQLPF